MYLLDTNTCIDFALARSAALRDRVEKSYRQGIALSAITLAELRVGSRHEGAEREDEERLDRLIRTMPVYPFDSGAAEEYGLVARQVGVRRTSFDRLIAAHGRALGKTVVTRNVADFADVPGLKVENWTI